MPANYLEAGVGLTPGGVVLRGEINGFAKEALNAAYAEAETKNPETILLDFEEINCTNSTEIALILTLLAKAQNGLSSGSALLSDGAERLELIKC